MLIGTIGINIRELEMLRHMNYISLIQWGKMKQSESLYQVLVYIPKMFHRRAVCTWL